MATKILPRSTTTRNGLTVRTVRSLRTAHTGFIIPAGAVGKVLDFNTQTNKFMIDFGVANFAQAIDPRSDAIEIVRVSNGR